ncbi:histidinol-phosphate aminotransferase [Steroidobacter denitrificans]|uniref:Histidinol-phosphate aminotransferase n=1 Tax=Steroidobacter denitrificans TaxID=465721 RepID=A0A127F8X1_STEDE|nr:histidinol-phosphate transaminase [Steroidobacter denitrificans]AMN46867.1 histidinol-phosphate aminotransferase [Steroidobacter denitrificans]
MSRVLAGNPAEFAAPAVVTLAPYVPGKPIEELEREYGIRGSIKLASNENPLGPGLRALEAIAAAAGDIGLYPDGSGFALKRALAAKHDWPMDGITLGNGSNDVLVMIAEAFLTQQSEAVFSQYGFAVYPIAVQASGATARVAPARPPDAPMALGHDLDAMAGLVGERTRVVFIANPNNPTGTWLEAAALERFIGSVPPSTLVVIDEAYIEYAQDEAFPDASRWLAAYPHLVVTRTFSKAYGLAGLRIGYALSHPAVAGMLNRVRQAFNVNSLALAAARAALEDGEHLARSVAVNRSGMKQVCAGFKALGVRHIPSVGNFVLIDCGRPAQAVYESMLRQGVIVRPVGNYQLPNHLRITIGTQPQNERMLAALQQALH